MIAMTRRTAVLAMAGAVGLAALPATADEETRGTAEEAKAMVADAIAYYDEVGAEAAFKTFNTDPRPRFYDRDLYIFVIARTGKVVAQAADPNRVGIDAMTVVDAEGTPYGRQEVELPTPEGVWIDYVRTDPLTGEVKQKSSWVVAHDGYNFGCGIYKP